MHVAYEGLQLSAVSNFFLLVNVANAPPSLRHSFVFSISTKNAELKGRIESCHAQRGEKNLYFRRESEIEQLFDEKKEERLIR